MHPLIRQAGTWQSLTHHRSVLQATGDANYLNDANDFYQLHIYNEGTEDALVIFNWASYFWALNVLMAQTTDENTFHEATQGFLQKWVCAIDGVSSQPWPLARPTPVQMAAPGVTSGAAA